MKTGLSMDKKPGMVEVDLGSSQTTQHDQRQVVKKSYKITKIVVISMCCVALATIAAVTAYICLKSSTKEADALFVTRNGDRVQEHIKLTDDEAVIYKDGFAMVYDFSKGLIVHRWLKENAVMNSCFVESFNTTQFSSIDQMKSMMNNIKKGQANFVERDETETYIATDIKLPTSTLGPASRDLCNNKDVFFIRRVPENNNTNVMTSSRVKRSRRIVKEKTCFLFIFCKTKKFVVKAENVKATRVEKVEHIELNTWEGEHNLTKHMTLTR